MGKISGGCADLGTTSTKRSANVEAEILVRTRNIGCGRGEAVEDEQRRVFSPTPKDSFDMGGN